MVLGWEITPKLTTVSRVALGLGGTGMENEALNRGRADEEQAGGRKEHTVAGRLGAPDLECAGLGILILPNGPQAIYLGVM